jgi:hypothetical protein
MKKFLLLLVAAVLAGGLILGCAQPSSFEVTLKAGSAEGVASDSIKVEPFDGFNLITWKGTSDTSAYYTVYRKSIINDEIDEGTIVKSPSTLSSYGSGVSPIKGIAYRTDTDIVAGAKYVYGVVSYGYKDNSSAYNDTSGDVALGEISYISDIVWQAEPEGGYAAAKKPVPGTELPKVADPTATFVRVNTVKNGAGSKTDVTEKIVITLSGLVPGYKYDVGIAAKWWNPAKPVTAPDSLKERDWGKWGTSYSVTGYGGQWISADNNVFSVRDYLDYGGTKVLDSVALGSLADYTTDDKTYDNWKGRVYVQIGSNVDGVTYPYTGADTDSTTATDFDSNVVKVIGDFNATGK